MPRLIVAALSLLPTALIAPAFTQTVQLDPHVVTATRAPQAAEHIAASATVLDADTLRRMPSLSLDAALRSVPGFSLFRRSDSFTAHPTAQGVSLRGLGPSGASRSLVLLDGVPLNDPFGGWVAWSKVPRQSLARVELVPGGGASAWGNAALGGAVHLLSEVPARSGASVSALVGDFGTRSVEASVAHASDADRIILQGRAFSSDGFSLVAPERRGAIDIGAWSRHRWVSGSWTHTFSPQLHLGATLRGFSETRSNGTPYQQNSSEEQFLSLHAGGEAQSDFTWSAIAYAQDQSFASTFSAVNATRSAETPASDQFAVPATAVGGSWTGRWSQPGSVGEARTSAGAEVRFVRGETRENFMFSGGEFTRQRVAGGRQRVAGVFAFHDRPLTREWRGTVGARVDHWADSDGRRRELNRITGTTLRNDRYADQAGTAFSPSAGLVWQPQGRALRLRAHAQRSFRRPTLNELYRPFRVGPNVTEANAALRTEKATSAELGGEWTITAGARGSPSPGSPAGAFRSSVTLGAVGFWNELRDAVGNVTIVRGPGMFPIVGFVPAGGVGRQRMNLERTRVRGLELSARWRASAGTTLLAEYLYNDATVARAVLAPALVANRIAQVPRHTAALTATVAAPFGITLSPRVRWIGRQFEDDENQLILGEVVVADLGVSYALRTAPRFELFANLENLGDARIETGRTAGGLVNIGTRRLIMFGFRGRW